MSNYFNLDLKDNNLTNVELCDGGVCLTYCNQEIRIKQDDYLHDGKLRITVHENQESDFHAEIIVDKKGDKVG